MTKDKWGRVDPLADQGYNRPGVEILDRHKEGEDSKVGGSGVRGQRSEVKGLLPIPTNITSVHLRSDGLT